jgi:outer membrane receptor protein involved in Fe transport
MKLHHLLALFVYSATSIAATSTDPYDRIPGSDPLLKKFPALNDVTNFRYTQGQRFNTIALLLPIMDLNPQSDQPHQDYATYREQEINLLRGLTPVSYAIQKTPDLPTPPLPKADFTDEFEVKARLINGYTDANNGTTSTLGAIITNAQNRLMLLGLVADHDEYELANGDTLKNSDAQRQAYAIAYGHRYNAHTFNVGYLKNSVEDAGNVANTFDTSALDAEAWVYSYQFDSKELKVNALIRLSNLDRKFDSWTNRDWYPNQAVADSPYISGSYESNLFDVGSPVAPCTTPPCTVPNTGPLAVVPGAPLFTDADLHLHLGEFNSLIDVKQGVDIIDWRLDFTLPFREGTWTSGIDGYRRDISLIPRKDYDNPAFNTGELANPTFGTPASVDWENFAVNNYVEDNAYSVFSELQFPLSNRTELYLGARISNFQQNQTLEINEDGVVNRLGWSTLGLQHVLEELHSVNYIGTLGWTDVRNDDLDWDDTYLNLHATLVHQLNSNTSISGTLASYHESPASFERIFPAPLDPASNTIDGRIYMGNIALEAEHHKRLELAISHNYQERFYGSARVYFDHVDDYIQGVPVIETTNDRADLEAFYELSCGTVQYTPEGWNNLPLPGAPYEPLTPFTDFDPGYDIPCNGDNNPLRYDNIEAQLYGIEGQWGYRITDKLLFSGIAAWQRGERRDTGYIDATLLSDPTAIKEGDAVAISNDDLYRFLPPYTHMNLSYFHGPWATTLQGKFYMKQDHVSKTNMEQETSGYGVFNAIISYKPHPAIGLDFGVNNLFDKQYTDHLTAVVRTYNQTGDSRYADYGDRIGSLGRNSFVRLSLGIKWPLAKK